MDRKILSLFDYSGVWSQPYVDADYDVRRVDLENGLNVMDEMPDNYHGIMAAPPCTDFAASGARWWKDKDPSSAIMLVEHVLDLVRESSPRWWVLENPVGRLNRLIPVLKKYGPFYFQPCDYGDPYTKKTGLWGRFIPPLPLFCEVLPIAPTEGSKMHLLPSSKARQRIRSETPQGFARAYFEANP